MERVVGIGGYFLRAADPAALSTWYRDNLGLDTDENGVWHQEAGVTVFAPFEADTEYFEDLAPSRPCSTFRVPRPGCHAGAAFGTSGPTSRPRLKTSKASAEFGWVTDPEGNRIELWQPARLTGNHLLKLPVHPAVAATNCRTRRLWSVQRVVALAGRTHGRLHDQAAWPRDLGFLRRAGRETQRRVGRLLVYVVPQGCRAGLRRGLRREPRRQPGLEGMSWCVKRSCARSLGVRRRRRRGVV